eukprot:scaffold34640_cov143-Amphora_coffeaeformis.AAC.5
MSSQRGAKKLLEMYPQLKQGIAMARRDILGHIPKTSNNARTGYNRKERRRVKLIQLRRRGKGPPKKGSGKRKKK